jgi:hypothetical protein
MTEVKVFSVKSVKITAVMTVMTDDCEDDNVAIAGGNVKRDVEQKDWC